MRPAEIDFTHFFASLMTSIIDTGLFCPLVRRELNSPSVVNPHKKYRNNELLAKYKVIDTSKSCFSSLTSLSIILN